MQDLTLVGVHDDGEHLVLQSGDGQRYLVKVDEPLRAAVRRDRARLGQLQIEQAATLRPRDIQAMIRAGRTAAEVAADAGVPVEHVRRYEGPVLAEREFVTSQARAVRVRRATPGAPGSWPTLDELVTQRLAAREVDAATASWDAWRTDGTWFIRLTFPAAGRERRAEWSYDVQLRHVTPLDDEARWFVDEPSPAAGPLPGPGRRALAPVRDGRDPRAAGGPADGPVREHVYDVEADGGLRQVEDERAGAAAATVDLLDTLRERRGRRQLLPDPADDSDTPDALERAVDQLRVRAEALGEPPSAHPPRSRPEQLEDAEVLALPEAPTAPQPAAPHSAPHSPAAAIPQPPHPAPRPTVQQAAHPAGTGRGTTTRPGAPGERLDLDAAADGERSPSSRRARRASVPSWDDIVFGSRRD